MNSEVLQNIIEVTVRLYEKFGIKSVTMDDIARECMISKKTLYKYVDDKVDLLKKALEFQSESKFEEFRAICDRDLNAIEETLEVQKKLFNMAEVHNPAIEYDLMKYYPVIYRELLHNYSEHIYNMIVNNLKKGVNDKLYYNDIDIDLIAKQRVVLHTSKFDNPIVSFQDFANPYAIKQMFKYHLRAICSPKGLEILNRKLIEIN